jgi:hypothetical protein
MIVKLITVFILLTFMSLVTSQSAKTCCKFKHLRAPLEAVYCTYANTKCVANLGATGIAWRLVKQWGTHRCSECMSFQPMNNSTIVEDKEIKKVVVKEIKKENEKSVMKVRHDIERVTPSNLYQCCVYIDKR